MNVSSLCPKLAPMKFLVSCCRGALVATVLLLFAGCTPPERGQSDEEKDPHFLAGKSRVNAMDFSGAIESFKRALQANPKSAAAHFELAWLFDRKQGDPAAAIYHYENYLRLRPKAENAEIVRQQVLACKQELARTVSLGPVTEKQQRDLEKMIEENKRLIEENKRLAQVVTNLQIALAQNARGVAGGSTSGGQAVAAQSTTNTQVRPVRPAESEAAQGGRTTPGNAVPRYRTVHRVRAGETLTSIAGKYGVRLESLQAANPGVEPRRLRLGRELNIP